MKTQLKSLFAITLAVVLLIGCSSQAPQAAPTPVLATPTSIPATPDPNAGGLTITLVDNGKTFNLKVGDSALLKLGYDYDWTISIADESILSRVKNIMVINGAQGVYQALKAGTTVMSITGDPVCRTSTPPCMAPSIAFEVTFVVK
jgi:hypothetical protein